MFCCQESESISGMAQFRIDVIIKACESTLDGIKKSRRSYRKRCVQRYIESMEKRQKSWWWFWGKKSKVQIIKRGFHLYYNDGMFPDSLTEGMISGKQEDVCDRILRTAKATDRNTMWLSPEGVSSISL